MFNILDRYIIKELFLPFIVGLSGFIVIMLSVRISGDIHLIITEHIPANIILRMMLYKIPEYIVMGMSIAYLIAILLTLARLGKDNEITALRACGVSFKRIILPILFISLIVSYISFLIMEYVVPYANQKSNSALLEAKKIKQELIETNDLHFRGMDTRIFSIKKIDQVNRKMEQILIYDNKPDQLLKDGITHKYSKRIKKRLGIFVDSEEPFNELFIDANILLEDFITERKPQEMSSTELKEIIKTRKIGGQDTKELEVEFEVKHAKPLASFFAALIAAPIGSKFSRFGGYIGVAISIILIFIYFVTESITVMVGNLGVISPFLAAWTPDLLFAVIGFMLLLWIDT